MRKQKVKQKIRKTVQQSIPIDRVYRDGIFQYGKIFSKTWRFSDINYKVASAADQEEMFRAYSAVLNGLPTDGDIKITIYNHRIGNEAFIDLTSARSEYSVYAKELSELLKNKMSESNNIVQEKYITVSSEKHNIEEARSYFARVGSDLGVAFAKLNSSVTELGVNDRLRIFYDFFQEADGEFSFDLKEAVVRGKHFKDSIAPHSMKFKKDCIIIGDKLARVLFLKEYPSFLKDNLFSQLTDFSRSMMISADIRLVPTDEAVKLVQKKLLAVETDITKWQQKQNENNNFSASIPYEKEQMRSEIKEYMDDLTSRDQRMMFVTVTVVHTADTVTGLNNDTQTLMSIGQKGLCTLAQLKYQQEWGLNTVLPYGLREITSMRTLTTEGAAALMPFKTQELTDGGGLYYGINAISRNLLMCDRKKLLNGNGFILGVSGSGKSFAAKMEIVMAALFGGDDILIVDAEREYGSLVKNLGGEVLKLAAASQTHINALEISKDIDMEESPAAIKSEFLISLFDRLLRSSDARLGGGVGAKDKSIIDRCAIKVYGDFLSGKTDIPPTLIDFREELMQQPEEEAKDLALSLEIFTTGSLNAFAHQSNVNTENRIVCYDILELGEQMKSVGLLIMLDNIFYRVMANRKRGRHTRVYIDEAHLYFKNPYSAEFLLKAWKRFRKYGGLLTAITQNISECLLSETARGMLSNSEFLLMLNQSPSDRQELAELLSISEAQMSHITNSGAGKGLIKFGGAIVPFVNDFPKDTELYRLMNTKLS